MGVLPLQLPPGQTADGLGLDGTETLDIAGLSDGITPGMTVTLQVHRSNRPTAAIRLTCLSI